MPTHEEKTLFYYHWGQEENEEKDREGSCWRKLKMTACWWEGKIVYYYRKKRDQTLPIPQFPEGASLTDRDLKKEILLPVLILLLGQDKFSVLNGKGSLSVLPSHILPLIP